MAIPAKRAQLSASPVWLQRDGVEDQHRITEWLELLVEICDEVVPVEQGARDVAEISGVGVQGTERVSHRGVLDHVCEHAANV
jgi:hypothetical protein